MFFLGDDLFVGEPFVDEVPYGLLVIVGPVLLDASYPFAERRSSVFALVIGLGVYICIAGIFERIGAIIVSAIQSEAWW